MPSEKTVSKAKRKWKSKKPIMEKRRRARINNSLSELKNLILDALKKDYARYSKLEKADILEMTVKYLQNLQMQQMSPDPALMSKFWAGFTECTNEVTRFMDRAEGIDHTVRQRLLNHLASCLAGGMNNPTSFPPVHVPVGSTETESSRMIQALQLLPTRLPTGEGANLLPASLSVCDPSTVPMSLASSTSSVSSPVSTSSSPGPVNVLGSADILSPTSTLRCCPSPLPMHHTTPVVNREVTPMQATHYPVIVPTSSYHQHKVVESKNVWRPF